MFTRAFSATTAFVLLWSSGAIFARLGLDHASPLAFLTLRFALALGVLLLVAAFSRRWLPPRGERLHAAATGALLLGGYSICYLLALEHGVKPGVLATVLGVQPLLTALLVERRVGALRLTGLVLALGGLLLVVHQGVAVAGATLLGMAYALGALTSMTSGAILQKRISYEPTRAMPLQYAVSLMACVLLAPAEPFEVSVTPQFVAALLWLGLVISVLAQLLLYRLIKAGSLVNVTSLFYLVPGVTAAMDYVFLGNALSPLSVAGMGGIVLGLVLVFRTTPDGAEKAPADVGQKTPASSLRQHR